MAAGVPLEPPSQTAILDAILAAPASARLLAAGVPGAGGFDALFVISRALPGGRSATLDDLLGPALPPAVSPCLCSAGPPMGSPGAGAQWEAEEPGL